MTKNQRLPEKFSIHPNLVLVLFHLWNWLIRKEAACPLCCASCGYKSDVDLNVSVHLLGERRRRRGYSTILNQCAPHLIAEFEARFRYASVEGVSHSQHCLVYVPVGARRIVIVALICQTRDVPAILHVNRFIIQRQLKKIFKKTQHRDDTRPEKVQYILSSHHGEPVAAFLPGQVCWQSRPVVVCMAAKAWVLLSMDSIWSGFFYLKAERKLVFGKCVCLRNKGKRHRFPSRFINAVYCS